MLSGYVLVYQYGLGQNFSYGKFLAARFFRLYIPYISAVFLGLLLFNLCDHNVPATNLFISQLWHLPVSWPLVLWHLTMIGNFNTVVINPIIWSLVFEMRISILFPILLYAIRLPKRKLAKAFAIVSVFLPLMLVLDGATMIPAWVFSCTQSSIFTYSYSAGSSRKTRLL